MMLGGVRDSIRLRKNEPVEWAGVYISSNSWSYRARDARGASTAYSADMAASAVSDVDVLEVVLKAVARC